jgi:hypothetical protein
VAGITYLDLVFLCIIRYDKFIKIAICLLSSARVGFGLRLT